MSEVIGEITAFGILGSRFGRWKLGFYERPLMIGHAYIIGYCESLAHLRMVFLCGWSPCVQVREWFG